MIPLPQEYILMQRMFCNASHNDLPIWDEPLEDGVDYYVNMFLLHESTLLKENDIMVK